MIMLMIMIFLKLCCFGQIYPRMDPLGTSQPKFIRPIQLQNNIGLKLKKLFNPSYLSKGCHVM
jgi:hypothetical protein